MVEIGTSILEEVFSGVPYKKYIREHIFELALKAMGLLEAFIK